MSTLNTELNLEVEVEYTCVSKGRPESGPTYSCGGEPAEPPEFEIDRVMLNGVDVRNALSDEMLDELRNRVAEDYAESEPDYEDRSDDDY